MAAKMYARGRIYPGDEIEYRIGDSQLLKDPWHYQFTICARWWKKLGFKSLRRFTRDVNDFQWTVAVPVKFTMEVLNDGARGRKRAVRKSISGNRTKRNAKSGIRS